MNSRLNDLPRKKTYMIILAVDADEEESLRRNERSDVVEERVVPHDPRFAAEQLSAVVVDEGHLYDEAGVAQTRHVDH